jgi:hypothetical protein
MDTYASTASRVEPVVGVGHAYAHAPAEAGAREYKLPNDADSAEP